MMTEVDIERIMEAKRRLCDYMADREMYDLLIDEELYELIEHDIDTVRNEF